jgi:hypothetical protein
MGRRKAHIRYWWKIPEEKNHYEDGDVGVWIILKSILRDVGWGGMG